MIWNHALIGDGCWEWQRSRDGKGYGKVYVEGKMRRAHRVAFEAWHGRPPEGFVLHRCDNPPCIRPDHLFEGDDTVNRRDAVAKGRARGRYSGIERCAQGHDLRDAYHYKGRRICRACRRRYQQRKG